MAVEMASGITVLPVDQIRSDGDTQPRVAFNHDVISEYALRMLEGASFPPVIVFHDGKDYWLADGFHRLHATKRLGWTTINADVRAGTLRDARLYSVGANVTHGLHRSNEDKRRSVRMLLEDDEWSQWSDREIARRCGVSPTFVGKMREELSVHGLQIERNVERNGSIYTIIATNIGHHVSDHNHEYPAEYTPPPTSNSWNMDNIVPYKKTILPEPIENPPQINLPIKTQDVPLVEVEEDLSPLPTKDVQLGQIWRLGRHLLYCGDSSSKGFIDLAEQAKAALAFADPPYNAGVAEWDTAFRWSHDYLSNVAPIVAVTPGISAIKDFMCATSMPYKWSMSYWVNNGMTRGALGFGNWIYVSLFTESSLYRNAQDLVRIDDMEQVSITAGDHDPLKHKGRKPIRMLRHLIELFTQEHEKVIDPFLGTGTTLIACEQIGRSCVGAEINSDFCESIIRRWELLTGREAEVL